MIAQFGSFRLESRAARLCCASVAFIASLAVYWFTLAPTVTLVDSGELIVAASTLGVAHPPGFPLYVALAHLATLVPIGSIAVRVNFASAVFGALASAVLTLTVAESLLASRLAPVRNAPKSQHRKRRKKTTSQKQSRMVEESVDPTVSRLALVTCLATGLLAAFSRTVWSYATIAEVYTLNILLIVAMFLMLFHWRRLVISEQLHAPAQATKPDRWLNAAAFVFGLGLGVHHVTVGLMLPAVAWLVLSTEGLGFVLSKRLFRAALCALGGLTVYLYLPLAAAGSPLMNWGNPSTLERFWWHVTGRQYQVFLDFSLARMFDQLGEFFAYLAREFGPWYVAFGLVLIAAGALAVFRRDNKLFWFFGIGIACDVIYSSGYEISEDKDAYYMPAFALLVLAAAFSYELIIEAFRRSNRPGPGARTAMAATLVMLAPAAALAGNLPFANRSAYFIAQDYVDNILNVMEPGGMLLTKDWQVYSPMLYINDIERRRPDIVAIDVNQLRRSWYFDYLQQVYPDTIAEARDKVDAFLEDLSQWQRDPDLYQTDLGLNQRINTRFYEMIRVFVTNHMTRGRVYVTQDIAINREGADAELTKWLSDTFQLVPQRLVFQLVEAGQPVHLVDLRLSTRGLTDGSLRFETGDVVKVKVIPVYAGMLHNRGRYLSLQGRYRDAAQSFEQALEIDPDFAAARRALDESTEMVRRSQQ